MIDKILASLKQLHKIQESIPTDYILHFSISFVIVAILNLLLGLSIELSVLITLLVGFIKEKFVDDVFDTNDIWADCIGILLYILCIQK